MVSAVALTAHGTNNSKLEATLILINKKIEFEFGGYKKV